MRELMLGPKRYTDLKAGLPGLSTDVLAQRLRELEAAGLLRRTTLPPPALREVLWHGRSPGGLAAAGELVVTGDRAVVRRFLRLFPPPLPAR